MIRVVPAAPVISVTTAPASSTASPSLGSELHGKLDAEGQPLCQPCAWFHKGGGCQNGASCRRCHLCPDGELKLRKKQKVQRLRQNEAAAAPDGDKKQPDNGANAAMGVAAVAGRSPG